MRGSKARHLRRIAVAFVDLNAPRQLIVTKYGGFHGPVKKAGKYLRDTQLYQLMQGRRTRPGPGEGTPFNYIRHKPGTAKAYCKQLKRAWKGQPLTLKHGETT